MTNTRNRQTGAGAVGTAILLVVLAYGVFVGIQYVPQFIEWSSITRILENVAEIHHTDPARNSQAVEGLIDNQLYVNDMTDMRDAFEVDSYFNGYSIKVSYERKLNLIYETKTIKYEKTLLLD
jgi:hypothetical protein